MLSRITPRFAQCLASAARTRSTPLSIAIRNFADNVDTLKKTALYDAQVKANAKIVDYCGYAMGVQFSSLTTEHNQCRNSAALFDVSHMGQIVITGENRVAFLETLCVTDIAGLKENFAKLSVLTNEAGGVYDDCMITKKTDHIFVVLNAGCKDKDMAHINAQIVKYNAANPSSDPIKLTYQDQRALLALQGPKAAEVVGRLLPSADLVHFGFMHTMNANIAGVDVAITRCGYTGEDGFEIGCANADATKLWDLILAQPEVLPAGLGARDSLRLEAGLCLYGHELDETISPVEAGLAWAISPRRKREGGFIGDKVILDQLQNGVTRKLVGVEVLGGAPARQGALVLDKDGKQIGTITSGAPSPTLNMKKIAMAYVETALSEAGNDVQISVRGKNSPGKISKLPFVETHYYRVPKN